MRKCAKNILTTLILIVWNSFWLSLVSFTTGSVKNWDLCGEWNQKCLKTGNIILFLRRECRGWLNFACRVLWSNYFTSHKNISVFSFSIRLRIEFVSIFFLNVLKSCSRHWKLYFSIFKGINFHSHICNIIDGVLISFETEN